MKTLPRNHVHPHPSDDTQNYGCTFQQSNKWTNKPGWIYTKAQKFHVLRFLSVAKEFE